MTGAASSAARTDGAASSAGACRSSSGWLALDAGSVASIVSDTDATSVKRPAGLYARTMANTVTPLARSSPESSTTCSDCTLEPSVTLRYAVYA